MLASVWQDTRPVTFISSGHNPDHTKSIRRKKGDGSTIDVECPVCIVDYNQYMGGVDRGDQYRKYYHGPTKSRKSYITLIHHHLVVNTQHYPAKAPTRRICKLSTCNR